MSIVNPKTDLRNELRLVSEIVRLEKTLAEKRIQLRAARARLRRNEYLEIREKDRALRKKQLKGMETLRNEGKTWSEIKTILVWSDTKLNQMRHHLIKRTLQCAEPFAGPITLGSSLNDIEMSVRLANCCNNAGCKTIGDAMCIPERGWRKLRGFGNMCLHELRDALAQHGFEIPESEWQPSKIRITKSTLPKAWYSNRIGETFDVLDYPVDVTCSFVDRYKYLNVGHLIGQDKYCLVYKHDAEEVK